MSNQIALFDVTDAPDPRDVYGEPDLSTYDHFIVAMSGKDSLACLLHLLELGAPRERIELMHHLPDGREGSTLFDWPITHDYETKLAEAFGLPIYMSWREHGLEGEMLRKDSLTRPVWFETPDGTLKAGGVRGKPSTRRKFPQQAADLKVRWCSSVAKIDVSGMAINNQTRFLGKRTLFITGERAAESGPRARYATFEPHRTDRRSGRLARHVDHWRPVHSWSAQDVWDIIKAHGVNPHPAYRLGFGRLSCQKCIFSSKNQWSTIRDIDPEGFEKIAQYEDEFNCTINRTMNVREQADLGSSYPEIADKALVALAMGETYDAPIFLNPEEWEMPAGAFGESNGPT